MGDREEAGAVAGINGSHRDRRGIAVGAAGAASVALALALALGLIAATPGGVRAAAPAVLWGAKAGPVSVHGGTLGTVAALKLPAGSWWVTAKGMLEATGGTVMEHRGVTCRLVAGSHQDLVNATPNATGEDGSRVPFLLSVAHRFSGPGKVKLRCVAEAGTGSVKARDIRITALRVGRLTVLEPPHGPVETGSGSPRVIALQHLYTATGFNDADFHSMGAVAIPAGRWWIVARTTLGNDLNGSVTCRLVTDTDGDLKRVGISASGFPVDAIPVALQVVHHFPSASEVRLECQGYSSWTVNTVAIAAIKAGRLTNRALDSATEITGGSGTPVVISGWSDDPRPIARGSAWKTVRSLALPAGRWSLVATLWVVDSMPASLSRRTSCRLRFGSDTDEARVRQNANITMDSTMVLTLTHASSSSGSAKLQCKRTGDPGSVTVNWLKITAIGAASLTKKPI